MLFRSYGKVKFTNWDFNAGLTIMSGAEVWLTNCTSAIPIVIQTGSIVHRQNNDLNIGNDSEILIAKGVTVSIGAVAVVPVVTIAAGFTFVPTQIIARNAPGTVTTASFGFGFDGAGSNVVSSATHEELVNSNLYTVLAPKSGASLGGGESVLSCGISVADANPANTITVDVYGYYY